MPSKGSPKITVRATPEMIDEIQRECLTQMRQLRAGPKTVTEFVLAAINEKLAHLKRSRTARANRKAIPPDTSSAL